MKGDGFPSVMSHQFSRVPKANIERSSFDRSHGYKTTFDGGYLVPFYVDEVLPGDTFKLRASIFCRLSTPLKPVMDNAYLDTFFFFVPLRLLWTNFPKFMGAQDNPGDSTSFTVPQMAACQPQVGELADYMGVPVQGTNGLSANIQFNSLHLRAYNRIWNEWFRDQNLQNSITVDLGDGPDTYANYTNLQRRGKRHDYFTSCLPWPQKGTAVSILTSGQAVVKPYLDAGTTGPMVWRKQADDSLATVSDTVNVTVTTGALRTGSSVPIYLDPAGKLYADLSTASAATINGLRTAFALQKMYERDARGGTRYTEIVKSHFNVDSPDARLQRAEYLGGGTSQVNIHPVPQTSNITVVAGGNGPQGNLAGFGTISASGHGFTKSFTEHGVIIGLVSVRADLTYQQGLSRMWQRRTRQDFYWPGYAHIGEQAVTTNEIWCTGTASDTHVFGYQERYAEYRYKPSQITGKFRSVYSTPLDVWHWSQKFTSEPTLGSTFIVDNPPFSRSQATTTEPQFFLDAWFDLKCARPMPVFGVPGMIDRF